MHDPAGENTDSTAAAGDVADRSSVPGGAAQRRWTTVREVVGRYLAGLLVRTWGPTAALWTAPPTAGESRYLADNGVAEHHRQRILGEVLRQNLAAMLGVFAIVLFLFAFGLRETPLGLGARTPSFVAGELVACAFYLLFVQRIWSPRRRLLASIGRAVRLVLLLDPRAASPSPFSRAVRPYLADPGFRRRRVEGVAWALTRDTARFTGSEPSAGMTAGEVLLWFAENPADPRRRPVLSAYLVELATAVASGAAIPAAAFLPATRFRTRSPREPLLRRLRTLGGGALATGIIVAAVTAVLRIWIK